MTIDPGADKKALDSQHRCPDIKGRRKERYYSILFLILFFSLLLNVLHAPTALLLRHAKVPRIFGPVRRWQGLKPFYQRKLRSTLGSPLAAHLSGARSNH
jgi:hypothetical protein